MRAAQYDIHIEQGATFEVGFRWTDKDGDLVDLTDADIAIKIRPTKDSATVISSGAYDGATNTPTGDIVISEDGALGTFSLEISAAVTEAFDFTQAVYDLEISDASSTYRVLEGKVFLSKEVTR